MQNRSITNQHFEMDYAEDDQSEAAEEARRSAELRRSEAGEKHVTRVVQELTTHTTFDAQRDTIICLYPALARAEPAIKRVCQQARDNPLKLDERKKAFRTRKADRIERRRAFAEAKEQGTAKRRDRSRRFHLGKESIDREDAYLVASPRFWSPIEGANLPRVTTDSAATFVGRNGRINVRAEEGAETDWAAFLLARAHTGHHTYIYGSDGDYAGLHGPDVIAGTIAKLGDYYRFFDNSIASRYLPVDVITRRLWCLCLKGDYFEGLHGVGPGRLKREDIEFAVRRVRIICQRTLAHVPKADALDFLEQLGWSDLSVAPLMELALRQWDLCTPLTEEEVLETMEEAGRTLPDSSPEGQAEMSQEDELDLRYGTRRGFRFQLPLPAQPSTEEIAARSARRKEAIRAMSSEDHLAMTSRLTSVRIGRHELDNAYINLESPKMQDEEAENKRLKRQARLESARVSERVQQRRKLNVQATSLADQRARRRAAKMAEQESVKLMDEEDQLPHDELFDNVEADEFWAFAFEEGDLRQQARSRLAELEGNMTDAATNSVDSAGQKENDDHTVAPTPKGLDSSPLRVSGSSSSALFNVLVRNGTSHMPEVLTGLCAFLRLELGEVWLPAMNTLVEIMLEREHPALLDSDLLQLFLLTFTRFISPAEDDGPLLDDREAIVSALLAKAADTTPDGSIQKDVRISLTADALYDASPDVLRRAVHQKNDVYKNLDDCHIRALERLLVENRPPLALFRASTLIWEEVATTYVTALHVNHKASLIRTLRRAVAQGLEQIFGSHRASSYAQAAIQDQQALTVEITLGLLDEPISSLALTSSAYPLPQGLQDELDKTCSASIEDQALRRAICDLFGQLSSQRDSLVMMKHELTTAREAMEGATGEPEHLLAWHHQIKRTLQMENAHGILADPEKGRKRRFFALPPKVTIALLEDGVELLLFFSHQIDLRAPLEMPSGLEKYLVRRPEGAPVAGKGKWAPLERLRLSSKFATSHRKHCHIWRESVLEELSAQKERSETLNLNSCLEHGLVIELGDLAFNSDLLPTGCVGLLSLLTCGPFTYRRYRDCRKTKKTLLPSEGLRDFVQRVAAEQKTVFNLTHKSLVTWPVKFIAPAKSQRKVKAVPILPTYRYGTPGSSGGAHDRLHQAELKGHRPTKIKFVNEPKKCRGLPITCPLIKDEASVEKLLERLTRPVDEGGEGFEEDLVQAALGLVWGIDTGNEFLLALHGPRMVEKALAPDLHYLKSPTRSSSRRQDYRLQSIELLLRPQALQKPLSDHARALKPLREAVRDRIDDAQVAGMAGSSMATSASLSDEAQQNEYIIFRSRLRSALDRVCFEIIMAWGFRTDRRWRRSTAGPTERPMTCVIGDARGTSTRGLHSVNFVNTVLCRLMHICRSLDIPAIFVRVDEFCTSQLCPRRSCRDLAVERREPMLPAIRLDSIGNDTKHRIYRLQQCRHCLEPYNKDLSASQNIADVFRHLVAHGLHPHRPPSA